MVKHRTGTVIGAILLIELATAVMEMIFHLNPTYLRIGFAGIGCIVVLFFFKIYKINFFENKNISDDEVGNTDELIEMTRNMKKQIYDMHNLFEVSVNLTSILDYDQLVSSYLLSLVGQLRAIGAVILYPENNDSRILQPFHYKGFPQESFNWLKIPFEHPLVKKFQKKAIPLNLHDRSSEIDDTELLKKMRFGGIALLAPLMHKNKVMGIIAVGCKMSGGAFTQSEIEIFSLMSNMAAVGISNAKLYHEMELISITDELTNLYNYRFLKKQLNDEIARARRFDHNLSLVIFDVDFFKNYNDTLGHPAGDEVLRQMGHLLKNSARQSDIVSRYGGEEFCAILPEVDINGAWHFSERFRKNVESHQFFKEDVQPNGKLTISVGAACFPDDACAHDELLEKADTALYHAKDSGKNRVCLYSDTVYAETTRINIG